MEQSFSLWIDRISSRRGIVSIGNRLRIFGLHAIVFIEENAARAYTTDSGWMNIPPQSVLYIFPDVPYILGSIDNHTPFRWYSIVFNGPLTTTLERLGVLNRRTPLVADPRALTQTAYFLLRPLMDIDSPDAALERFSILSRVLAKLYRQRTGAPENRSRQELVGKAIAYMSESCQRAMTVGEVATRFAVSPTHLRRIFRRNTGHSVKHWLSKVRIDWAQVLLSTTDRPIKEIAEQCSFSDVYHFMRTFKKIAGTTPTQFRGFHQ